jgi:hypothetical protein
MEEEKDTALLNSINKLSTALRNISPRKKKSLERIDIVFMDTINNKQKHNRFFEFSEVIYALDNGSTPIAIILVPWNINNIEAIPLPDISDQESELIAHALAEAEDEMRSMMIDDNEED